jgi:folate-binding protein YgfZ
VQIAGPDATPFLHAQVISHLRALPPAHGTLSAWCTPQGRVSCLFHVLPQSDGYLLILPASEASRLVQRLRLFVLRAQVTIVDITSTHGVLGIRVPAAAPAPPWAVALHAARGALTAPAPVLLALCIDASARYLCVGPVAALREWWEAGGATPCGAAAWRLLDILQGHAEIVGDRAGAYLPQQLNLDMQGALSFDKGCYPGQEVVARLRYRGVVKSRLLVGHASAALADNARLSDAAGGGSPGQLLDRVTLPDATVRCSAVVDVAALMQPRAVADHPDCLVRFEPPPYWRE